MEKEEEVELRRTNKNMFNWVKVVAPTVKSDDLVIEDDGQDEWMDELMRKEERLARMEVRRKESEKGYICKDVVEDILEKMARSETEKKELQEKRIKSIMVEIKECSLEGIIIMEIENQKSIITESNRLSNEPGVIRGQSNGSPISTPVMG